MLPGAAAISDGEDDSPVETSDFVNLLKDLKPARRDRSSTFLSVTERLNDLIAPG